MLRREVSGSVEVGYAHQGVSDSVVNVRNVIHSAAQTGCWDVLRLMLMLMSVLNSVFVHPIFGNGLKLDTGGERRFPSEIRSFDIPVLH